MNTIQSDSVFSRYVNVRVMLSIMLSVLFSAMIDLIMKDPPNIAYAMNILPFIYVVFVMYLITYFIESIPSIGNWLREYVSPNKPVGNK